VARTIGGTRALILPAGYLGAALFGAALFYLANTVRRPRSIAIGLGIVLIVFSVLFAAPDPGGAPLALIVGLAFGAALIGMGWKLDRDINLLVLNVLALLTALNAVLDLVNLTRFSRATETVCGRGTLNDAAAFSCEVASGIPPYIWAGLWALIALALVAATAYYAILRPLLKSGVREEAKPTLPTV
jgi:hypothetical protein